MPYDEPPKEITSEALEKSSLVRIGMIDPPRPERGAIARAKKLELKQS